MADWDKLGYWTKYQENNPNWESYARKFPKIKRYSDKYDKRLGLFMGYSNLLGYDKNGNVLPPAKIPKRNRHNDKQFVEIANAFQEDFEKIIKEVSPDLREIYFFKCPRINDYSALEKFPNLEYVGGYWNNGLKKFWDVSKNSKLNVIAFDNYSKLDCDTLSECPALKHFFFTNGISGTITIKSFDFLRKIKNIKDLYMNVNVLSNDIRPILELRHLENYYVGDKYHKYINKYLSDGSIPVPSIYNDMPTRTWLEGESTGMTRKQIRQIEKILGDYTKSISTAQNIEYAKQYTNACVVELNKYSEVIETQEREALFEYLVGKVKEEWYEEIIKTVDETRDW